MYLEELSRYVNSIETSVKGSYYFRPDVSFEERKRRILSLGRDLGYGLGHYNDSEVKNVINGLYSSVVVVNCFDNLGVPVSAKEWIEAIQSGMDYYRRSK